MKFFKGIITLSLTFAAIFAIGTTVFADEFKVSNTNEIVAASAKAKPGDTLIMKNGTWENVQILFQGKGTEQKPITLKAESPGKVIIKGESSLKIAGSYLVVDGLVFKDVYANKKIGLIDFSNGSAIFSDHCRLTNTVMEDCNPINEETDYKWVSLYGKYNRVDHCYFRNKTNIGTLLVVWREDDSANYHLIDNNYFGYTARHSVNGGETIRVGDSTQSLSYSNTTVENNYFEHCNGDIEVISSKSCGNIYRNNTFFENEGSLSLRHGNECIVEGNYFIQNHIPNSVGVRVMGENHKIYNNYFYGMGPTDGTMRGALNLINGIQNTPINGYYQVKNVQVMNNLFVDNEKSIMLGGGKSSVNTLVPLDCRIENNVVLSRYAPLISEVDKPINLTYKNNTMYGSVLGIDPIAGITLADPQLVLGADGIFKPLKEGLAICGPKASKPLTENDVGPSTKKLDRVDSVIINLNGNRMPMGAFLMSSDKNLMVPLRSISAAMGYKIKWVELTKSVVLMKPDAIITVKLGSKTVDVNGKMIILDTLAQMMGDRIMVSVQFINDLLSKKAYYDEKSKFVIIEADMSLISDADADAKIAELMKLEAQKTQSEGSFEVISVIASSDDGNVPSNTLDKDLSTRWAASGIGEWIEFDLGKLQKIGYLGIVFNKGNERKCAFQVMVSKDKQEWTKVYNGESNGKTNEEEIFKLEPQEGRYVKLV
ncbi:MAG: discoidin domain-containing protein, partial [Vallitaleaceae bacterium]|nr:discoidin domain-containing protein [Vallitaleaceae bacterium]